MIAEQTASPGRLVVVSYPRSGTHLLRTLLESHPAIRCQAEPFNSDSRRLPYDLDTPTQEILDRWVYPNQAPDGIVWQGFVLQAYHPFALEAFPGIRPNPRWANVWDRLAAMDDLRVIFLERRDLLRRHLSHRLSRETGRWHDWDPKRVETVTHLAPPPDDQIGRPARGGETGRPPLPRLRLDAQALEQDFREVARWRSRARERLGHLPSLDLEYEELCRDGARVHRQLLDFLGLPPRPLVAATRRLEHRPLGEAIHNLETLGRHFRNTPWAKLFES